MIRSGREAAERDRAGLAEANALLKKEVDEAARTTAELRRAEASNRLLASVVEQSGDAIYTRDLDGRITSWNKGAERLYGWTAEEALGQPLHSLNLTKLSKDEIARTLVRIRAGQTAVMEVTNIRKSGEDVHIALTTAALYDAEGKHVGENIVARDISERKRVQAELKRANEELEARVAERTAQWERANLELQTEIAERHHAVEELAKIEALLRSIMDSIPAMITYVDSDQCYRFFNRRFGNWVRLSGGRNPRPEDPGGGGRGGIRSHPAARGKGARRFRRDLRAHPADEWRGAALLHGGLCSARRSERQDRWFRRVGGGYYRTQADGAGIARERRAQSRAGDDGRAVHRRDSRSGPRWQSHLLERWLGSAARFFRGGGEGPAAPLAASTRGIRRRALPRSSRASARPRKMRTKVDA